MSQLGRWALAGNIASHIVKVVTANGVDVVGGAVTLNMAGTTPGQYAYTALASPVTLLANTSYFLVTQEFAGGDQWYEYSPVAVSTGVVNAAAYQQPNGLYITLSPGSSSYGPPNFLYSSGSSPAPQPPPTVTISSPAAGIVSSAITLAATATPSAGLTIVKVQFQLNGNNVSSPLDSTTLANGPYSLTAVATDSAGSSGTSPVVAITVGNASSPTTPLLIDIPTSNVRNDYTGFVGLKFTGGSTAIKVSQLGRWVVAGNTAIHNVKLVDALTGADLAGGSVSVNTAVATPGQYAYTALASPLTLAANHSYYLLTQETSGGDQWYDAGTVTANSVVTINGPAYQQSNGAYALLYNGVGSYGTVSLSFGF